MRRVRSTAENRQNDAASTPTLPLTQGCGMASAGPTASSIMNTANGVIQASEGYCLSSEDRRGQKEARK